MSTFAPSRHASILTTVALALSATATAAVVTTPSASAAVGDTYRMTVAPDAFTASDGTRWEARTGFDKGDFSQSYTSGTIAGAADSRVYYPEFVRFSSWSKPVDNGTYRVTLKMREMWWTKAGERVFDVAAEGRTALQDLDIVKAVGRNAAYDRSFDVAVSDGRLNLAFTGKKDAPLVSALQITRIADPAPAPAPTPAPETKTVVARMSVHPQSVKDAAGHTFAAASGFSGGSYHLSYGSGATIKNTRDTALYTGEQVGMTSWSRSVPNGTYDVTLKMREQWWTQAGQRVFDVYAEDGRVLADVDILKAAGRDTAYDRTVRTVVKDGRLDLRWVNKTDKGLVSAIVVNRVENASTTPSPTPTTPTPTTPTPTTPTPTPTTPTPTPTPTTPTPTKPATPSNSAYGKLSGMHWDSGTYPMNLAGEVTKWEQSRGRKVDVITVFPARQSWNSMQSTWFMDNQRIPAGYQGTLDIGVPLWPDDGNLATAKAGGYNAQWEQFARTVAAKYPNAYIRLGWEMNLPGWKAAAWANTAEDWKQAYRQAVTSIRKGGPNLRIAWVPNEGAGQTGTADARVFYPGDAYVDYIGIDAYDWWPGYTTDANIARHRDGAYGWNFWLDFAKERGKKFVLPEWGVAPANSASGGDNPKYINFVYDWMNKNREHIAYESYFSETMSYIRSDLFTGYNPKASAEYKRWMSLLGR